MARSCQAWCVNTVMSIAVMFVAACGADEPLTPDVLISVAITGGGAGTIAADLAFVSCQDTSCSARVERGMTVRLYAMPALGSAFVGWGGACTGAGVCTLVADDDKNVQAQFSGANSAVWSAHIGSIAVDAIHGVELGASGEVFALVSLGADGNLGGTSVPAGATLLALSAMDGGVLWQRPLPGVVLSGRRLLAQRLTGELVIAGMFTGTITVGSAVLTSAGDRDIAVIEVSPTGAVGWAARFGGAGADIPSELAASGALAIAGTFEQTVTFGNTTLGPVTSPQPFLATLDGAGAALWAIRPPAHVRGATVVADGAVLTASDFLSGATRYLRTARYDASGGETWSVEVAGGAGTRDGASAVALDRFERAWVVGGFDGAIDFGDGVSRAAAGELDMFALRQMAASGTLDLAATFGGAISDAATAVEVAGTSVFVAGNFESSDFAPTGMPLAPTLVGMGAVFMELADTGSLLSATGVLRSSGLSLVRAENLAVTPSAAVFAGTFEQAVLLGRTDEPAFGSSDIFIVRTAR